MFDFKINFVIILDILKIHHNYLGFNFFVILNHFFNQFQILTTIIINLLYLYEFQVNHPHILMLILFHLINFVAIHIIINLLF